MPTPPLICFTPELQLDPAGAPGAVAVKGRVPAGAYGFSLLELYPQVPSLDVPEAYGRIAAQLQRAAAILGRFKGLRPPLAMPPSLPAPEASALLAALLDPQAAHPGEGLLGRIPPAAEPHLFRLDQPRPFPLRLASHAKLLHTLAWIDSNVKLQVEDIAAAHGIETADARELARMALAIYCLLAKMQDYRLAQRMNFNHSMFLQDRIVNLVFGDALCQAANAGGERDLAGRGLLSNRIALGLLRGQGELAPRDLCALGIFMGVLWVSRPDVQADYRSAGESTLARLDSDLRSTGRSLAIDHIDRLLGQLGADRDETIAVVLDDNGESVFDLALFQSILRQTVRVRIALVVNRHAVSNNIALATFEALVADPYFDALRQAQRAGRVTLCIEQQLFRSFEEPYLLPGTLDCLRRCSAAFIKGANFFESLQLTFLPRYYCFTVSGFTSVMLSGCPEGSGICAAVPAGIEAYRYEGPGRVWTLRDVVFSNP